MTGRHSNSAREDIRKDRIVRREGPRAGRKEDRKEDRKE
jgi:hypothetical protein